MLLRLGLIICALLAGCDERSERVRHAYVERHRDAFVFEAPQRQLTAALRQLYDEHGYKLIDAPDTATTTLTTTQRERGGAQTEELVTHVIRLEQRGGFLVHIVKVTREANGSVYSSDRLEELEWELIQRVEPDRALEIMSNANERADKVKPGRR